MGFLRNLFGMGPSRREMEAVRRENDERWRKKQEKETTEKKYRLSRDLHSLESEIYKFYAVARKYDETRQKEYHRLAGIISNSAGDARWHAEQKPKLPFDSIVESWCSLIQGRTYWLRMTLGGKCENNKWCGNNYYNRIMPDEAAKKMKEEIDTLKADLRAHDMKF